MNKLDLIRNLRKFIQLGNQIKEQACTECKAKLLKNPGMKANEYCTTCQKRNAQLLEEAKENFK